VENERDAALYFMHLNGHEISGTDVPGAWLSARDARMKAEGMPVEATPYSPIGIRLQGKPMLSRHPLFLDGSIEVQDEGSQIVCRKAAPAPGQMVWDVCAGSGGKSLFLAALMKNKGRILATDIRGKKLEDLKKRASRAGAHNIFPADLERLQESRELKKGADIVLVDAPCSGSGTLRRNPDAKWKIKEEDFAAFHKTQLEIIEKSLPYLKPGGKLCYVTCSLDPVENEEVMRELFEKHPELKPLPAGDAGESYLRLVPHKNGTDGFFLAMAENRKDVRHCEERSDEAT
jgi:16S rRNA (cytosine967-C5)-methyltransferase